MGFLLRLLKVALGALLAGRRSLLEPSRLRLRVWPNDLDLNFHMNNGRYLSLMDLGRVDLMFRTGALHLWLWRGQQPLVAASFCRHFKPLNLFQAFELRSRVVGWDEKWVYFEQRFVAGGRLHALGAVKALLAGKGGPVPTAELFRAAGHAMAPSPELPAWMRDWLQAEGSAIHALKAEREGHAA